MSIGETIRCADRREFDKLSAARVANAAKVIVGDTVVIDRTKTSAR